MECNRDEAVRAKCIAESKLEKREFTGAKKFALKAQTLYPDMDGITQLIKTIDVYVSAENKVSGEVDWYGVLEVSPLADDETIKKQYRKLALLLHPDKNKSVGADGAFKLVSEAWNLLSDKVKRLTYNQRRGCKGFVQKVHRHAGGPSVAPRANGIFNFAARTTSATKLQNHTTMPPNHCTKPPVNPSQKPSQQRTDTFWTICHQCKMHYEYLKRYLNQTLLCPNCRGAFMASETAPPQNFPKTASQVPRQRQRNLTEYMSSQNAYSTVKSANTYQNSVHMQAGSHLCGSAISQVDSISGAKSAVGDPSTATKATNIQQAHDKLKRPYNEPLAHMVGDTGIKKQKVDGEGGRFGMSYHPMQQRNGGFGNTDQIVLESRTYGYSGPCRKPSSIRDLTPTESRQMIMVRARSEIRDKLLSGLQSRDTSKEKAMIKQGKKVKLGGICNAETGDGNDDSSSTEVVDQPRRGQSAVDTAAAISVPDPDFHDFDVDRAETSFGDGEVWSGYDDEDGMPRFYALVSKVISRKPFKVRISWLNSKSTSEFSSMEWVGSGFYKTCGEFRVGRYEICKSINAFSQKLDFLKTARGSFLIYPKRGDVWALYKNWSTDWNEHTPDEVIHKYEMVNVVEDYNEEQGVLVVTLMKMSGFKTVFRPIMEQHARKRRIPREEMLRFSHRVPYRLLTGLEAKNAPRGCLELDPAATPMELLQVIPESTENVNTCAEGSRSSYENTEKATSTGQAVNILKAQ